MFPSMWAGLVAKGQPTQLYFADAEIIENHYTPFAYCHARAIQFKEACGDILRRYGFRQHDPNAIPEYFK